MDPLTFAQVTLLTCSVHFSDSVRTFLWMREFLNYGSQLLAVSSSESGVHQDTQT